MGCGPSKPVAVSPMGGGRSPTHVSPSHVAFTTGGLPSPLKKPTFGARKFTSDLRGLRARDGNLIEFSQTIGNKTDQQDMGFAGLIKNPEAGRNPRLFLRSQIAATVERHKDCKNGTTLCSAIARNVGDDVEITVGSLGDSRATLIIKHENGEFESITLNEPDDLIFNQRTRDQVGRGGGLIRAEGGVLCGRIFSINKEGELRGGVNMGASVGDRKYPLKREADVLTFHLSQFLRAGEKATVNLVIASDGAHDLDAGRSRMGVDKQVRRLRDGRFVLAKGAGGSVMAGMSFSAIARQCDARGAKIKNLAESLMTSSYEDGRSSDNITAMSIRLMNSGNLVPRTDPVMGVVCDGHGSNDKAKVVLGSASAVARGRESWDGSLVAASVAADLFVAANIELPLGLEQLGKGVFGQMLGQKRLVSEVAIEAARARIDVSKTSDSPPPATSAAGAGRVEVVVESAISATDEGVIVTKTVRTGAGTATYTTCKEGVIEIDREIAVGIDDSVIVVAPAPSAAGAGTSAVPAVAVAGGSAAGVGFTSSTSRTS